MGGKVISLRKLNSIIIEIFNLRSAGLSQTEVASRLGLDRTLVCRLESLAEVRKGRRLAVLGFPVANKDELEEALQAEGVDFILLLNEHERWEFVRNKSGIDLFDSIMELIALIHTFDQVIFIGSNKRIKIIEAVLDKEVIGYEIGESPILEDKHIPPGDILSLVRVINTAT
jgi:transcriptional regulator